MKKQEEICIESFSGKTTYLPVDQVHTIAQYLPEAKEIYFENVSLLLLVEGNESREGLKGTNYAYQPLVALLTERIIKIMKIRLSGYSWMQIATSIYDYVTYILPYERTRQALQHLYWVGKISTIDAIRLELGYKDEPDDHIRLHIRGDTTAGDYYALEHIDIDITVHQALTMLDIRESAEDIRIKCKTFPVSAEIEQIDIIYKGGTVTICMDEYTREDELELLKQLLLIYREATYSDDDEEKIISIMNEIKTYL